VEFDGEEDENCFSEAHIRSAVDSVVKQSKNAIRVEVFGRKVKSDDDVQVWNATTNDGVVTSVEINRRHPVIQSAIEAKVVSEKLLQLLERTLPIDVIYYSRSGEQKLTNEVPLSSAELLEMLKGFINMIPPGVVRKSAFQTMLMSEPFVMHADMLRAHEKEVLNATI
jgi:hypothetical protein